MRGIDKTKSSTLDLLYIREKIQKEGYPISILERISTGEVTGLTYNLDSEGDEEIVLWKNDGACFSVSVYVHNKEKSDSFVERDKDAAATKLLALIRKYAKDVNASPRLKAPLGRMEN